MKRYRCKADDGEYNYRVVEALVEEGLLVLNQMSVYLIIS